MALLLLARSQPGKPKNQFTQNYGHSQSFPDGGVAAWVQATNIGLDAFADNGNLVVWANSLKDGSPLDNVKVNVIPEDSSNTTGNDGLTSISLDRVKKESKDFGGEALLIARRGDDLAILPKTYNHFYQTNVGNDSWRRGDLMAEIAWYVFDDRKLYRPGEEVNVKGWLRKINLTPKGGTEMYSPVAGETVSYVLKDSQDNEITKGETKLNAFAGFNLRLKLPPTMDLGNADLDFNVKGSSDTHSHNFEVQEFRRPEFEIATTTSEAPHFVGSSATATVTATYYAGGGLLDAAVDWTVFSTPTNYTPPNRGDYTFGKFYPWWIDEQDVGETKNQTFQGRTDSSGKHTLKIDFDGVNPPRPASVLVAARVQDVNRQTLSAETTMLVHPSNLYVGLRSARTFVQKGDSFEIGLIATDIDGKAVADREIKLRFVRLDYVYEKGEWKQKEVDASEQIVLALDRYFNTYEKTDPNFTARVWLGDAYAGEQIFKGRSVDRRQLNLPMAALVERTTAATSSSSATDLIISKEGDGRLYYRIGTRYAPTNLKPAPADYGFEVGRKYEAIDDTADVRRDDDGVWHIKAGARIRVHLTMSNPARRYHVALVDPFPAGFEPLNFALATTEKLPSKSTERNIFHGGRGFDDYYRYSFGTWYEHQNLRDERAEAFTSMLWEGVHEYSYFVRATTPGTFVAPPPKAEAMYAPETFGRGQTDFVRVE